MSQILKEYDNYHSNILFSQDRNYPEGSRLFIVLMGTPLSEFSLHEIFAPFGGLEFVRLQKDKNYGYVKVGS